MMNEPFDSIRGVYFDLDGTLKVSVPSGVDALLEYMADYGIPIDQEARRAGHRFAHEYWADRDRVEDDMDTLGPDNFWANYIRSQLMAMSVLPPDQAPDDHTVNEINRRFATEFAPQSQLATGAETLLSKLREHDLILGLVSNRPLPLKDTAERLGIYDFFHFTLAAGEIGSWKPDPGIFQRALEMGGYLKPEQVLYVGDNYYADVLGARAVGLKAALIDPHHAFPEAEHVATTISGLTDLADLLP